MDDLESFKESSSNWKVKVYLLNDSGNWDDCGTGQLDIVKDTKMDQELDYFYIVAQEEVQTDASQVQPIERLHNLKGGNVNPKCIMYLPISKENQFEKQGDSIISWVHTDLNEEIAISFIDLAAAEKTWRKVCQITGRSAATDKKYKYDDLDQLVMPTANNLQEIKNMFENKRDWMIQAIVSQPQFLDKLSEVFNDLEDLESIDDLHIIYQIVKTMIFHDEFHFIELILSDQYYMFIFGALEYDPSVDIEYKQNYREFLKNKSYYKKVIDFQDERILKKIHMNFRINYLKDSFINSIVDDPLTNQFNTIIYINNQEIFDHLMQKPEYFDDLFDNFLDNIADSTGFMFEIVQIMKPMVQGDQKLEFIDFLLERNFFALVGRTFSEISTKENAIPEGQNKNTIRIQLIEVLNFVIQMQVNSFIDFLNSAEQSQVLINSLAEVFFYGDQGLQIQVAELIRYLIDSYHERKNELTECFYSRILPQYLSHFKKFHKTEQYISFVQQFVDLLIHCVKSHGYRIRHQIIHHKLLQEIYQAFKCNDKNISLAIIKLVKAIVSGKDEYLLRFIAMNNLMEDIMKVYFKNSKKSNLMNSACLDLFETIRKENIKVLVEQIVENFREQIEERNCQADFNKLFQRYDQYNEKLQVSPDMDYHLNNSKDNDNPQGLNDPQKRFNQREINSMDDEQYFESEEEKINDENEKVNDENTNKPNDENRNGNQEENKEDKGGVKPDSEENKGKNMFSIFQRNTSEESEEGDSETKAAAANKTQLNFNKIRDSLEDSSSSDEENDSQSKQRLNIQKIKEKLAARKQSKENEESKSNFVKNSSLSRTSSIEKISNKIDIQLNIGQFSEDGLSEAESVNSKRAGVDLDSEASDEIRDESKIDMVKKVKSQDVTSQ